MKKPRINKNRVVEFLQPYSNKQKGEKVSFGPVLAASLVSKGVAAYADVQFIPADELNKHELSVDGEEQKEKAKPKTKSKKQKKDEKNTIPDDSLM